MAAVINLVPRVSLSPPPLFSRSCGEGGGGGGGERDPGNEVAPGYQRNHLELNSVYKGDYLWLMS